MTKKDDALKLARLFHTTYERLAPEFGYETRTDTKVFDPLSSNGRLMLAVCSEIYCALVAQPERQPLTVDEVWQNDQVASLHAELRCNMDLLMEVIKAVEAAHGIGESNV